MPWYIIFVYLALIFYFFLPTHVFSSKGTRTTWLVRGMILLNGSAYFVSSDFDFGANWNAIWTLTLRFFFLQTSYVFALGLLYSLKNGRMPRFVGASIFFFYGVWIVACLYLLQTPLPFLETVDAALEYTNPVFLVLRAVFAISTMILFVEIVRCMRNFWKSEKFLAGRLRFGFLTISTILSIGNRWLVLATIITLVQGPSDQTALFLWLDENIDLIATLLFFLGCAPPPVISLLVRIIVYLNQQIAILELSLLRAALMRSTAPIPWPLPDARTRFVEPSYALYSVIIDVLDRISLVQSLPATNKPYLDGLFHLDNAITPEHLLDPLRQMARRVVLEQIKNKFRNLIAPLSPVEPAA